MIFFGTDGPRLISIGNAEAPADRAPVPQELSLDLIINTRTEVEQCPETLRFGQFYLYRFVRRRHEGFGQGLVLPAAAPLLRR